MRTQSYNSRTPWIEQDHILVISFAFIACLSINNMNNSNCKDYIDGGEEKEEEEEEEEDEE